MSHNIKIWDSHNKQWLKPMAIMFDPDGNILAHFSAVRIKIRILRSTASSVETSRILYAEGLVYEIIACLTMNNATLDFKYVCTNFALIYEKSRHMIPF